MRDDGIKTAYKVVRDSDGCWKSAIIDGKACLAYAPGVRTYGFEGTPVTVFLSLGAARAWRPRNRRVILRGTAGNPRPQRTLVGAMGICDSGHWLRRLRRFWVRGDRYQGETMTAPKGTYAADWFEPERVVS